MDIKPKILIVDDKPENLVALETVLKDLDIELVKATSGNEALKKTLHYDFALALLDIQMPEMDGYELASILREEEKTSHLPFIFISAVYTDNLNVFKGYEKGAFSFITKPFQPEILINKVKFFVEKHQQEVALYELNKRLEKKNADLEFSNQELEAFTYSVSHDLRAPLRAISGYMGILEEEYGKTLDDEGKRLISRVSKNAVKMSDLIDSLLGLSRLGKTELKKSNIDMNSLVTEVLTELKAQKDFNAKVKIVIKNISGASGDKELLRQVFSNLISNAIKYSGKKDTPLIEIGSENKNDIQEILYYVKDNGVGFNMEYRDKLFGIFHRLHDVRDFEGIGIGLAIVKRIVTRHGGRVWGDGEIDRGAIFYFTLPRE